MKFFPLVIIQVAIILFFLPCLTGAGSGGKRWDWRTISDADLVAAIKVPENFLWGTATCEYQNSGAVHCPHNNWALWEGRKTYQGRLTIKNNQSSGVSADHWNRYRQDIQLMKALGVNAYRFSVEWSEIEPEEGVFNQDALNHYVDVCHELASHGITPMVTLLHFTYPAWFAAKGAFECAENISYFVRFCKKIFLLLKPYVSLFCTINEPTVIMLMGYILGEFPPGKRDFELAGVVLKNLLQAHCAVYEMLKHQPGGKNAQIGIVHAALKFVPRHWWNPIEVAVCSYFSSIKHKALLHFFRTGTLEYSTWWGSKITYFNARAPHSLDFFGLNYYSRAVIGMEFSSKIMGGTCFPDEVMTDMPYAMYAEGLYDAIAEASVYGVPLYITENGIADRHDNRRATFIKRYIYAMSQAIQDGYDVRGYFYWSLMDNFEWAEGFSMKFGLYEVDFKTQKRTLRKGAYVYRDIIAHSRHTR